ncbi:MAG: sulfurtransferase TusA family protein [Asgard group archaeon]|nr:sulfurtransferase TusA family protein [Asgard group archaeon]
MSEDNNYEKIAIKLDMTGKQCFEIRVELLASIEKIPPGSLLEIITDNPLSEINVPKWCRVHGEELFLSDIKEGKYIYYIKKTRKVII